MAASKITTDTSVAGGLRLLADLGGTNARFALARRGGGPDHFEVLRTRDYAGPAEAMGAYMALKKSAGRPQTAVIAVAGPVAGDRVKFTNSPWTFSIAELQETIGLSRLVVINDFEALAWALPRFRGADIRKFGRGRPDRTAPRVVFGPGSGLGAACYLPATTTPANAARAVATEGGHRSAAAQTRREAELIEALRRRFGHVSAERIISGPGLRYVYEALAEIDGAPVPDPDSFGVAAVSQRAREGGDALATETVKIFTAMAGGFAGDLALTYNARGGIYLAGGVIPRLGDLFDLRAFRRSFVAKGRYRGTLSTIPTFLIRHPYEAMVGMAHYLDVLEDAQA